MDEERAAPDVLPPPGFDGIHGRIETGPLQHLDAGIAAGVEHTARLARPIVAEGLQPV